MKNSIDKTRPINLPEMFALEFQAFVETAHWMDRFLNDVSFYDKSSIPHL